METLEGIVVFLSYSEGSKSESKRPFLYVDRNSDLLRLWMKEDNPFENNKLSSYDRKNVIIKGEMKKDFFEIAEINTKNDGGC